MLLRGWPVRPGQPGVEYVTPTGAALVSALARPGPPPAMVLQAVGTGAGHRDPPDRPNVLRVLLGHAAADAPSRTTALPTAPKQVECLAAQMDDLPGEHLPALLSALLDAGAVDAWATPVLMKKGRPGLLVEALAAPGQAAAVTVAMLRHGSTFGVRSWRAQRRVLDRWHRTVQTSLGPIRVKLGALEGEVLKATFEHEDLALLARRSGRSLAQVQAAAQAALSEEEP